MPKPTLTTIVNYCDRILRTKEVQDYEGAVNGLQVENRGNVTRIAATVDASLATVKLAIAAGADLMIVHHGLFWSTRQPWTGKNHELLRLLLENNLAVYSSHLPLDAHPRLGQQRAALRRARLEKVEAIFLQSRPDHRVQVAGQEFPARSWPDDWRARRERSRESFPAVKMFAKKSAW